MSYPILKTSEALKVGAEITKGLEDPRNLADVLSPNYLGLDSKIESRNGGNWDEETFKVNLATFYKNMSEDRKNGVLTRLRKEEDFAEHFMSQIELVDPAALQDHDFWRYLALFPYRRYIHELEGDLNPSRYGGDGNTNLVRWTLIKGMLWGVRTYDQDKAGEDRFWATRAYKLARERIHPKAKSEDTVPDFYLSQIVRRHLSYHKPAYLAFISAVVESPAAVDEVGREKTQYLGSRISRLSANIYLPSLTREEIKALVIEEKKNLPKEDKSAGSLLDEDSI
jgi:hypothetical protein